MLKRGLRSVGAVLGGLVAAALAVMVLTLVVVQLMFEGDFTAPPTTPYLIINLAYTFGAAMLGGWLAGRIAGVRPLLHATAVAAVMVGLSLMGGGGGGDGSAPGWYAGAVSVMGALGALCGGMLHLIPARRRAS